MASQIKKDPEERGVLFNTPFSNLKFKPCFRTKKFGDGSEGVYHGWIVKDTSQVKKISESEELPFPQLTFQVVSQKKGQVDEWGNYSHELIIEPVSLGVENLPPITCLVFSFSSPPPGSGMVEDPTIKNLKKSELYNSDILTNSVGKTFSVAVKVWLLKNEKERKSDEYHYNTLLILSDNEIVFDSFLEIKEKSGINLPNPKNNENKTSESNSNLTNSQEKENQSDKGISDSTKYWIGGGVILAIFGLVITFWLTRRKNVKRN